MDKTLAVLVGSYFYYLTKMLFLLVNSLCVQESVKMSGLPTTKLATTIDVSGMNFAPNGKHLVLWDSHRSIELLNLDDHSIRKFPPNPKRALYSIVTFHKDEKTIQSIDAINGLVCYDFASLIKTKSYPCPENTVAVTLSTNNLLAFEIVRGGETGKLQIRDLNKNIEAVSIDTPPRVEKLLVWSYSSGRTAFCPDGKRVAIAGIGRTVHVWSLFPKKELCKLFGHRACVTGISWSPDGRYIASNAYEKSRNGILADDIRIWNAESGEQVNHVAFSLTNYDSVLFSPDGKLVCSILWLRYICFWELLTGQIVLELEVDKDTVQALAYSPDGTTMAAGINRGVVLFSPKNPANWAPPKKAPDLPELEQLWDALGSQNAATAYKAMLSMNSWPKETFGFLKKKIVPFPEDLLQKHLANLDSTRFNLRSEAQIFLEKEVCQVASALRKRLSEKLPLETRIRIKNILTKDRSWPLQDPKALQCFRGIWVLQTINTRESIDFLKQIATGASLARQTQEAQAALRCMANLPNPVYRPDK